MQIKDIKVGVEYAAARSDYDYNNMTADKVIVEEVGVLMNRGWGSSASKVKGVRVKILTGIRQGRVLNFPSRYIREPWESYEPKVQAKKDRDKRLAVEKDLSGVQGFRDMLDIDQAIRLLYPERAALARQIVGAEIDFAERAGWEIHPASGIENDRWREIHTVLRYESRGHIHRSDAVALATAILEAKQVWATRNLETDEIYEHDSREIAESYGRKRGSDVLTALRTKWREVL